MRHVAGSIAGISLLFLVCCTSRFPDSEADTAAQALLFRGLTTSSARTVPPLPTAGLVGRWLFDGTYANSNGASSTLTPSGGPTFVDNSLQTAIGMDVGGTVSGATSAEVTIALNFYPTGNYLATQYDETTMFSGSTSTRWIILAINSAGLFTVRLQNGTYTHNFAYVAPNTWHSAVVAMRASDTSLRVWVDGVAQTPVTYNPTVTIFQADYGIRIYNAGAAHDFVGRLDNWMIYNRSVSDSEVEGILGAMR